MEAVSSVAASRAYRLHSGGDTFSTTAAVVPAAVLAEWKNNGTTVFEILGDGRVRLAVHAMPPATPGVGDVWFDGTDIFYQSAAGAKQLLTGNGAVAITVASPVTAGRAVAMSPGGLRHAGAGDLVVGIATASVASGSVPIAAVGEYVSLANWTASTGTADLVEGATYSLGTVGQLVTTGGSSQVGVAVSARTLLVCAAASSGSGLPAGGIAGQLLRKLTSADGVTEWWTPGTAASRNVPASGNASATEVMLGSDTRLTDARPPTAHASTHAAAGSDPVDHDGLLNYSANRHINHANVSITAGTGLTGGGDLTASRTLSIDFGTGHNQSVRGDDPRLSGGAQDHLDVQAYGAYGDDATHVLDAAGATALNTQFSGLGAVAGDYHDWAVIQGVLNTASQTGQRVYIPRGVYRTNKPLQVIWTTGSDPKIRLIYGDGDASIIKGTIASTEEAPRAVLETLGESNPVHATIELQHLVLEMSGGDKWGSCWRIGDAWCGASAHRCWFRGANGMALKIASAVSYAQVCSRFTQCVFFANWCTGWMEGPSDWWATQATAECYAVINESAGAFMDNIHFESCVFMGTVFPRATLATFVGCQFANNPNRTGNSVFSLMCNGGSLSVIDSYFEDYSTAIWAGAHLTAIRGISVVGTLFAGVNNIAGVQPQRAIDAYSFDNALGVVIVKNCKIGDEGHAFPPVKISGASVEVGPNSRCWNDEVPANIAPLRYEFDNCTGYYVQITSDAESYQTGKTYYLGEAGGKQFSPDAIVMPPPPVAGTRTISYAVNGDVVESGVTEATFAPDVVAWMGPNMVYHYVPYGMTERWGFGISASTYIQFGEGGIDILNGALTINGTNILPTLTGKQNTLTGGATTIATANLTASRALVSNSSGKVAVSTVTSTELGYLSGVTSALQTQINGKEASLGLPEANGYMLVSTTTGTRSWVPASGTYTLPAATPTVLGGIKIGTGLTIDGSGVVSVSYTYTLPAATASALGGVKVGSGLDVSGDGTLSATYSYTLPAATTSTLGGVIVGSGLSIDGDGVLSSNITKTDLGLGNVDDTSDANKPVSTATASALAGKEPALGNPASNGMVLASTTEGVRSWVAAGSGGGIADAPSNNTINARQNGAWLDITAQLGLQSAMAQEWFTASGASAVITLAQGAMLDSAQVYINGVLMEPVTDYTLSVRTLTFTFTPPANAKIGVVYLPAAGIIMDGGLDTDVPLAILDGGFDLGLSTLAIAKVWLSAADYNTSTGAWLNRGTLSMTVGPYQGNAAYVPPTITAGRGVYFNGARALVATIPATQTTTVFIVYSTSSTALQSPLTLKSGAASNYHFAPSFLLNWPAVSDVTFITGGGSGSPHFRMVTAANGSAGRTDGVNKLVAYTTTNTTPIWTAIDGVNGGTPTLQFGTQNGELNETAAATLAIGFDYAGDNGNFNGCLAEIAIFNRVLTAPEQAAISSTLKTKWGIS